VLGLTAGEDFPITVEILGPWDKAGHADDSNPIIWEFIQALA
jgi:hypothetical protein